MANKSLLFSSGDGSSIPAGQVGEFLDANGTATFTSATDVVSITLTVGTWLVNGYISANSATGSVVLTSQWKIKGVNDTTPRRSFQQNASVADQRNFHTKSTIVVNIVATDADKTVKINATNSVSQNVEGYISAVRLA